MLASILLGLLATAAAVELRQSDFVNGTYRITQPGTYTLAENIVFSPNENIGPSYYEGCWPTQSQLGTDYPADAFTLGFFAAITVETYDVVIDLNGHTLSQSPLHALLQRFYAHIELANSPFIPGQGPHIFTQQFVAASQVTIRNGNLGLSCHHGIHGNLNRDVVVENVNFNNYEVAALALNGVTNFRMQNCRLSNRKNVPVLGIFSSARFLQRYIDRLVEDGSSTTLNVRGAQLSATQIRAALRDAINNVAADVIASGSIDPVTHPVEYALFANTAGVIDGNSYGVLLNHAGVAVKDFPNRPTAPYTSIPSSNVVLNNVDLFDEQTMIREVVALVKAGAAVSDSVGAILQLLNVHPDTGEHITIEPTSAAIDYHSSHYTGNPVADTQLFLAKAIAAGEFIGTGLDTSRNGITPDVVAWAESGELLKNLTSDEGWQCNGDSMAHVQKGAVGFKIDGTTDARITDCSVNHIINRGLAGTSICGRYQFSHPAATQPGYNGAHARGFSFAGSSKVRVRNSYVAGVTSVHGNAIGFDIFTDSTDIALNDCSASFITAEQKDATGFHLGGSTSFSDLQQWCASMVLAPHGRAAQVWDEDGVRNKVKMEHC